MLHCKRMKKKLQLKLVVNQTKQKVGFFCFFNISVVRKIYNSFQGLKKICYFLDQILIVKFQHVMNLCMVKTAE